MTSKEQSPYTSYSYRQTMPTSNNPDDPNFDETAPAVGPDIARGTYKNPTGQVITSDGNSQQAAPTKQAYLRVFKFPNGKIISTKSENIAAALSQKAEMVDEIPL